MLKKSFYITTTVSLVLMNFFAIGMMSGALAIEEGLESYKPDHKIYLAQICRPEDCDYKLLSSIVECESGWRMVKNSSSTAYGYFQILDGTERTTPMYREGKSKYNPYDNLEMGVFLYKRDRHYPWMESKVCWDWRYRSSLREGMPDCIGAECTKAEE